MWGTCTNRDLSQSPQVYQAETLTPSTSLRMITRPKASTSHHHSISTHAAQAHFQIRDQSDKQKNHHHSTLYTLLHLHLNPTPAKPTRASIPHSVTPLSRHRDPPKTPSGPYRVKILNPFPSTDIRHPAPRCVLHPAILRQSIPRILAC